MLAQRRACRTYRQIAEMLKVAPSTIILLLRRAGPHQLAALVQAASANRYKYAAPGQLLQLNIKKLA